MIVSEDRQKIHGPCSVAEILKAILDAEHETDRGREHFWVIGVNNKNVIQYIELASLGTLTAALVHPREIFRLAIMKGVASIILGHNHPSGDSGPSQEDIILTKRLCQGGEILGIKVLDHIIIGETHFSFEEHCLVQGWHSQFAAGQKDSSNQTRVKGQARARGPKKATEAGAHI